MARPGADSRRNGRRPRYSLGSLASTESCRQCLNDLRPVNVINFKGRTIDRPSLQVARYSWGWLAGTTRVTAPTVRHTVQPVAPGDPDDANEFDLIWPQPDGCRSAPADDALGSLVRCSNGLSLVLLLNSNHVGVGAIIWALPVYLSSRRPRNCTLAFSPSYSLSFDCSCVWGEPIRDLFAMLLSTLLVRDLGSIFWNQTLFGYRCYRNKGTRALWMPAIFESVKSVPSEESFLAHMI
jgi:hypothetical protein